MYTLKIKGTKIQSHLLKKDKRRTLGVKKNKSSEKREKNKTYSPPQPTKALYKTGAVT
jgi:hypothetical protein